MRDGAYVTDAVLKDSTATFTPGVSERRGTTTTFSHSGQKNVDAQSRVSQAVTATQQYGAFGNLASLTGTWQGQFGYGGGFGYQQDATGLKLLGHRYYDASTGRFLTRDPIKDGRNWYVYCDSDPVGGADPEGLKDKRNQWNGVTLKNRSMTDVWITYDYNGQNYADILPAGYTSTDVDVDWVLLGDTWFHLFPHPLTREPYELYTGMDGLPYMGGAHIIVPGGSSTERWPGNWFSKQTQQSWHPPMAPIMVPIKPLDFPDPLTGR